jgi:hypothetical protein
VTQEQEPIIVPEELRWKYEHMAAEHYRQKKLLEMWAKCPLWVRPRGGVWHIVSPEEEDDVYTRYPTLCGRVLLTRKSTEGVRWQGCPEGEPMCHSCYERQQKQEPTP